MNPRTRTLLSTYWTGRTGKDLRKAGRDALLMGAYLVTCPNSNPLGLYYLPLPTVCHETGLSLEEATTALEQIRQSTFAYFDPELEVVWVPEMAGYQLGHSLKASDNRIRWIVRMLKDYAGSPFAQAFWDKYHDAFHLPAFSEMGAPGEGLPSPFQVPSKGLPSPSEGTTNTLIPKTLNPNSSLNPNLKSKAGAAAEATLPRVVSAWNEIPGVKPVNEAKLTLELRKRINQRLAEHKAWSWWAELFQLVRHSKFLTGQKTDGDFHASLWWVLGPKNLAKVLMGEYTDYAHATGGLPHGPQAASKLETWANEWDAGPALPGFSGAESAGAGAD